MKNYLFSVLLFTSLLTISQSSFSGLKYNDTKFALGVSIPLSGSIYAYNVRERWGGFFSIMQDGSLGINDDNYRSPWHELSSKHIVNHQGFNLGLTYRLWRYFHAYSGFGFAWRTQQLIYKDTPPITLDDAYRTEIDKVFPTLHTGIQFTYHRISLGAGYNSYKGTEYFIGYTIKVPNISESKTQ